MENKQISRDIPLNIEDERSAIDFILRKAEENKDIVIRKIISSVTERQIDDLMKEGVVVNEKWVHSIETSSVIHVIKRHGKNEKNKNPNQVPITKEDFNRIPSILKDYDKLTVSKSTTKSTGNPVIRYEKKFIDGTIFYLEEKRDGRMSLALQTMYKKI